MSPLSRIDWSVSEKLILSCANEAHPCSICPILINDIPSFNRPLEALGLSE